jgi:DNA-binding winged helix-turn-helix (wHTH) protein
VATGAIVEDVARGYLDALDPATRRVLEATSVTRRTTLSLLEAALPGEPPGDAFARLRELPFVELGREGLIVHDAVREATALRLKALDPVAYRAYRAAAWRCLRRELRGAARHELWRYTADMLYLIEDEAVRENFFPSIPVEHDVTPAQPEDWPDVEALARRAGVLGGIELLRAWWDAVPSAFAVARDGDGRMSGFRSVCGPHDVPARLIDRDPLTASWRAHLRSDPIPRAQRAVFVRYVVRVEAVTGFDAALAALLLDLKRVYVGLRPELRRIYTVTLEGSLPYCAMTLGYVAVPGSDDAWVNDLGPGSIDGWLTDLGARELLEAGEPLDLAERRLVLEGDPVDLTRLEAALLAYLRAHEGRAVTRDALLRDVWGHEWTGGSNVIEVVVSGLRKKLGDRSAALETVRGVGYRLHALT